MSRTKAPVKFFGVIVMLVFAALSIEGILRLQQKLGPLYDLETAVVDTGYVPSSYLNHVVRPGGAPVAHGARYDRYGIRINGRRPALDTLDHPTRVLFLGDSFMAGMDDAHTIPQMVYEKLISADPNRELAFYNAGAGSYGVLNYIIQSRVLPGILDADIVVVDVDETDLSNDYFGRSLVVRDFRGEVVAYQAFQKLDLLERLNEKFQRTPLYTRRFVDRILTTHLIVPTLAEIYERHVPKTDMERWFLVSRSSGDAARRAHPDAIELFRKNMEELATVLKRELPSSKRIAFAMHAHLQHFDRVGQEMQWNRLIATIVNEVSREQDIFFYDGLADMKKAFGNHPEDFYFKNDMHLNEEGLRVFAEALADALVVNEIIPGAQLEAPPPVTGEPMRPNVRL